MAYVKLVIGIMLTIIAIGVVIILVGSGTEGELEGKKIGGDERASDYKSLSKRETMRGYIQEQVNPCETFDEYSCSDFVNTMISPGKNYLTIVQSTYEKLQLNVVSEGIKGEDADAEIKVKHFYKACQNFANMKPKKYKQKLREIIIEFGQMPLLASNGTWQASKFDWWVTIAKIRRKYGIDIILKLDINEIQARQRCKQLSIQHAITTQLRRAYETEASQQKYKIKIFNNLQQHLGVKRETAFRAANEILNFEKQLVECVTKHQIPKSELRSLDTLLAKYKPDIDFEQFISIIMNKKLNVTILERDTDYQLKLIKVVRATPKEQVANYITYKLIEVFIYDKSCFEKTRVLFSKILDNIIFHKNNLTSSLQDVDFIWKLLKTTFHNELKSNSTLNWMPLTARERFAQKLNDMKLEIFSYDKFNLSKEYIDLKIVKNDYLENLRQVLTHKSKRALEKYFQPPTSEELEIDNLTPVYFTAWNFIGMPIASLLHSQVWPTNYKNAAKFGTIGFLLAQQMLYGLENSDSYFDDSENIVSYWNNATKSLLIKRKDCFMHNYKRFFYGNEHFSILKLQKENIAYNGGVQMAYKAYMNWLSTTLPSKEPNEHSGVIKDVLVNINNENKQLFFLSLAQLMCNSDNDEQSSTLDAVKFQVLISLANFDEFSSAFYCELGTQMNPRNKCTIF